MNLLVYPEFNIKYNDPCPCQSGKKFKQCCRGKKDRFTIKQWAYIFKKYFNKNKCYVPLELRSDCSHGCKSHSIGKSSSLKFISESGHLYGIKRNIYDPNVNIIQKIGINKASTFLGFCHSHDSYLFKKIDKGILTSNRETAFLFSYRSLCRELYCKEAFVAALREALSISITHTKAFLKQRYNFEKNVALRDIRLEKKMYDYILLSRDYNHVSFLEMIFDNVSPFVTSVHIFPYFDFSSSMLQDPSDFEITMKGISLNIINQGSVGRAIFTVVGNSNDSGIKFIRSINTLKKEILPQILLNFIFEYSENVFVNIPWWDSLDPNISEYLIDRFNYSSNPSISDIRESEKSRVQSLKHDHKCSLFSVKESNLVI